MLKYPLTSQSSALVMVHFFCLNFFKTAFTKVGCRLAGFRNLRKEFELHIGDNSMTFWYENLFAFFKDFN